MGAPCLAGKWEHIQGTPGKCATSATGTLYWAGVGGEVDAETDLSGNVTANYIYFGGARIAKRDSSKAVHFYYSDHLGSTSLITDANGDMSPQAESDYYPYGGEIVITADSTSNHYKYTGKERDAETCGTMCLDNFKARYDASALGRFMTPDLVGGHMEDPQTLNRYAYVRNTSSTLTDPTGLDSYLACQEGQDNCTMRAVGIGSHGVQWESVQTEKVDGKNVAIQIGSDGNGGLKDTKTGQAYTGSANGHGMFFSNDGGKTSSMGIFDGWPSIRAKALSRRSDPDRCEAPGEFARRLRTETLEISR